MSAVDQPRDFGPYASADHALRQFANWSAGMPEPTLQASRLSIIEVAMLAGVKPSEFELNYLQHFGFDPVLATILAGWITRAHIARTGDVTGSKDGEGHSGHTST